MKKISVIRKVIQIAACIPITIVALNNFKYFSVVLLLLTAIAGAFYCGYLCPFGLLQEIASAVGKKLKIKQLLISRKVDSVLRLIRYVLYISISILSITAILSLLKFDARSSLYLVLIGKQVTMVMIISIVVFFVLSVFYHKPFCKYFCIKGAEYGLLSNLRLFSIKRDKDICINCKLCDKACDMNINVSTCDSVKSMNCINCFECIKKCPRKDALTFGLIKPNKVIKKIAVASLLIIIYVGTIKTDSLLNMFSNNQTETVKQEAKVDTVDYYDGEAEGYNGLIKVKVAVKDGVIKEIEILEHIDDEDWFEAAKDPVITSIIEQQSTEVDVVTGATYSSYGIMGAVQNAIDSIK